MATYTIQPRNGPDPPEHLSNHGAGVPAKPYLEDSKRRGTVYLVDDDPSVRRALMRLLRSDGIRVCDFANADEFLRSAPEEEHACLVLDVDMQGTDGLALQEILKAQGSRLPVVFISAMRDPLVHERAINAGAVAFIIKPFSAEKLLGLIHDALSMRVNTHQPRNDLPR